MYYTDGSKTSEKTSWAYHDPQLKITVSGIIGPLSTVFIAELTAIKKCIIYHLITKPSIKNIIIATDSLSSIQAI